MTSYARNQTLLLFFLTLSHAIMIQQWNRNRCGTGSVQKKSENQGFRHNFLTTHKGYNSAVKFNIIGQSRHEKDWVFCLMRILARCVEVLRQFDFPLKTRSELFEPHRGEFERSGFRS